MERSESGLMSDLELRGGSPRQCRLRADRLAPMNKFDYALTHASCKPSCFCNCLVEL
jgi:hypothetical protein